MSEKIKLLGSVGRGVHYLKQLLDKNGNPSNAYRLLTDLQYRLDYFPHEVGDNLNHIQTVRPAGGPNITVGNVLEEVQKTVKEIYEIPQFGVVILTS